jgi:hypothetical protein
MLHFKILFGWRVQLQILHSQELKLGLSHHHFLSKRKRKGEKEIEVSHTSWVCNWQ